MIKKRDFGIDYEFKDALKLIEDFWREVDKRI
jgi:hypothetical protein